MQYVTLSRKDFETATTDAGLSGTLSANDIDVETLTFGIAGGTDNGDGTVSKSGTYGTLTLDTATGDYTYAKNTALIEALDDGETGQDNFTFTVSDGDDALVTRPYTVNVSGADDQPTLAAVGADPAFEGLGGSLAVIHGTPAVMTRSVSEAPSS